MCVCVCVYEKLLMYPFLVLVNMMGAALCIKFLLPRCFFVAYPTKKEERSLAAVAIGSRQTQNNFFFVTYKYFQGVSVRSSGDVDIMITLCKKVHMKKIIHSFNDAVGLLDSFCELQR